MKKSENQNSLQLSCEHTSRTKRHVLNQIALGSIILLWGDLLILKQLGIIEQSVSTIPTIVAAFGVLLIIGGFHALRREKRMKEVTPSNVNRNTN